MARPRAQRADSSVATAMSGVGSFADVMTVDEASCIPVDTDLPADQLALIGCGFTTGFGAAINTANVSSGATVAVIGCGGVGTSTIQGARVAGASRIIAIDPVAMKRQSALRFGATDEVDPNAGDPIEQVKALTGGRGVDFAFEVVGVEQLQLQALEMTRRGGTTVLVGVAGRSTGSPAADDAHGHGGPHGQGQLLRLRARHPRLPALHRADRDRPGRPGWDGHETLLARRGEPGAGGDARRGGRARRPDGRVSGPGLR